MIKLNKVVTLGAVFMGVLATSGFASAQDYRAIRHDRERIRIDQNRERRDGIAFRREVNHDRFVIAERSDRRWEAAHRNLIGVRREERCDFRR